MSTLIKKEIFNAIPSPEALKTPGFMCLPNYPFRDIIHRIFSSPYSNTVILGFACVSRFPRPWTTETDEVG